MSERETVGPGSIQWPIDVRLKISAAWAAMLFIFAYVDIFASLRADTVNAVLAGKVGPFDVDQTFLLLTTVYVVVPSLMVFLTLVLKRQVSRWVNLVLAALYAVSIVAGCIGETWWYYLAGSAVEVVLLAAVVWYAWTWPKSNT